MDKYELASSLSGKKVSVYQDYEIISATALPLSDTIVLTCKGLLYEDVPMTITVKASTINDRWKMV
jgi:hypothetical protein